ncbi:MAG: ribosome silencing factor [Thermodesulfobacteriota bacterium]
MKKIHKSLSDKSSLDIAQLLSQAALEKKAEDLVVLDVRGISSFADYFVIMSGRSTRHVQGLADTIGQYMSKKRMSQKKIEGFSEGHWVLLDYGDVVVHIFYHESREFYDLEGLWHDAPRVDVE